MLLILMRFAFRRVAFRLGDGSFGNFLLSVARPRRGRARPVVPPRRHLANWLK
jgi:hypothetical protein